MPWLMRRHVPALHWKYFSVIGTMRPVVGIGDIHGRVLWKKIVEIHPEARIVFLGDYLDPFGFVPRKDLLANLRQIVALKQENPENVVLLLGNHDLHYMDPDVPRASRYDFQIEEEAARIFTEHRDLFCYAWQEGNCLFTHAGVSQDWFMDDFRGDVTLPVAGQLNHPSEFQLPALFRVGYARGGKKEATGGIFWADMTELADPLHGYVQVVGHNRVQKVTEREGKSGGKIIFCDCLRYRDYLYLEHLF